MDKATAISLAYLVAAVLFILGLRQLSSPKGARRGNWTAAVGMVIALGTTIALLAYNPAGFFVIVAAVVICAVVGTVSARRDNQIRLGVTRLASEHGKMLRAFA